MIKEAFVGDQDPVETQEWLDAFDSVLRQVGKDRAHYLLERLLDKAQKAHIPYKLTTPYINTIASEEEPSIPGDLFLERRIRSLVRWNALAMVMRANQHLEGIGGHIATFASSATLCETGFNHFFRAPTQEQDGDLIYFQGHSSPGIYARAYLEGRLTQEQLDCFRQEVDGKGLSSYPHPWLMPDFWQFPTVSMGLGPLQAIYQARFMRYLQDRGLVAMGDRKVWAFMGDGEMDEPESLGAISLAGREKLDNLIFIVNCNLQRLDGPVRGNGKIIQELEGVFRGAGWNVIKVIWGKLWDPLLARDHQGFLKKRMEEALDGEYQAYKAIGGAYTREHFFGKYPELAEMVAHLSDEDIYRLNRGGHDPYKVYAAYAQAVQHRGQPTVILAKTIKGYGLGEGTEAQNKTHSVKELTIEHLKEFRDRFDIPLTDQELEGIPYYLPAADSPEMAYLQRCRERLGGSVPQRRRSSEALAVPELSAFENQLKGTGDRSISTTMAFVRILSNLVKDKVLGDRVVPIIPDEARTFGMEGMFRQLGIYSAVGQLYEPPDANQILVYREDKKGHILEEGITEPGAFASWMAVATSYSSHNYPMIPFYIFYSMFGFQRIGDLAWAAGDMRARGFLIGATAGRTTLNGEGLQHQDGHSHLLASTIPNCRAYDPTYDYELAVIIQDGLRRMVAEQENVFYYITTMNENYMHPPMPEGAAEGIIKGMYLLKVGDEADNKVQLLGAGTILREVEAAAELLQEKFNISADIWSVPSFMQLRREGLEIERWNLLHPEQEPRISYVTQCLQDRSGPVIAASDYMKAYADQIRAFVPARYKVLGTDGFGRSDTREKLRHFFEVDRYFILIAALQALREENKISVETVTQAMQLFNINPDKPYPLTL